MNELKFLQYLAKFDAETGQIYNLLVQELAGIGVSVTDAIQGDIFSFDDYPQLSQRVSEALQLYNQTMTNRLIAGMKDAINASFVRTTEELGKYALLEGKALESVRETAKTAYIQSRMKPFEGLSLSQRVWNYTQQTKTEFEMAVSDIMTDGLSRGISAEELARKVRGRLQNPDAMYRRYHLKKTMADGSKKDIVQWRKRTIDENGKVHFMSTDIEHPGSGVYRSSRKNALRMAATEINSAYRYGDCTRWKSEPFVIGIRIRVSDHHEQDMCDDLQGDYPKNFMWRGWHVRCRCSATSILVSKEEFEEVMKLPQEERLEYVSPNLITDMPKGYNAYIEANRDRITKSIDRGTQPWWIKDNYENGDIFRRAVVGSISGQTSVLAPKGAVPGATLSEVAKASQTKRKDGVILTPKQMQEVLQADLAQYSPELTANIEELEKLFGVPRGTSMSWELANKGAENPLFSKGGQFTTNCQTATVTHELRRRGFNVTAKGARDGFGSLTVNGKPFDWESRFLNADGSKVRVENVRAWGKRKGYGNINRKKLDEYFGEKMSEDGRYEIYCMWDSAKKQRMSGAHVFMAEKKNGVITFFDPQSGRVASDIEWYFENMQNREVWAMRVDDKIINPHMVKAFNAKAGIVDTADYVIPTAKTPVELAAEARHAKRDAQAIQEAADIRRVMTEEDRQIFRMLNKVAELEGVEKVDYRRVFRPIKDADGKIESVKFREATLKATHPEVYAALEKYNKTVTALKKIDTTTVGLKRGKILQDYIEQQRLKAISSIERGKTTWIDAGYNSRKKLKALEAERDAIKKKWDAERAVRNAGAPIPKKQLSVFDADNYDELVKMYGTDMPAILAEYDKAVAREGWTDSVYLRERAEIERKLKDYFKNVVNGYGHYTNPNLLVDGSIFDNGVLNTQQLVDLGKESKSGYNEDRCGWAEFAYKPVNTRTRTQTKYWKSGEYYRCATPLEGDIKDAFDRQTTGYGGAMIKFRKDNVITTFTFDNSLGTNQIPSLCVDPKVVSIDGHYFASTRRAKSSYNSLGDIKGSMTDYIEVQLFPMQHSNGVLGVEYIEAIVLPQHPKFYYNARKGIWDQWYEAHVDVYFKDSDGKVKLFRAGKPRETEAEREARISARNKARIAKRNADLKKKGLTPEERIKQLQAERADLLVKARANAQSLIDVADSIENADISVDEVKRLMAKGNYHGAQKKAEEIRVKVADLKVRRDALKDIIPDADDWHKKFTIDELEEAHRNIKKKIGFFESKYSGDLNKMLQKFIDERDYTKDPTQFSWGVGKTPHKTWEIAYNAYQKKVVEIEFTIKKNQALTALSEVEAYQTTNATFNGFIANAKSLINSGKLDDALSEIAKANSFKENYDKIITSLADLKTFSTKAKAFNDSVAQAEALLNKGDYSGAMAEVNKAIAKRKQIEYDRRYTQKVTGKQNTTVLQTVLKKGESRDYIFDSEEFTQAKKDAAKWFRAANPRSHAQIDQAFRDADKYMSQYAEEMWKDLTKEEKMVLWLYTDGSKYINDEMLQYFGKGSYCNRLVSVIDGTVRNGLEDGNLITSIIEKAPALKEGIWMQSGKSLDAMRGIFGVNINSRTDLSSLVGKEGSSEIFMSCHSARDGAFTKRMSTGSTNDVVLTIYMPKGTKGVYMEPFASFGDESSALKRGKKGFEWNGKYTGEEPSNQVEFVLQRGSKFRITKAVRGEDGKWYIDVDLIEQAAQTAVNTRIPGFDRRWNTRLYRANEKAGARQYN